MSFQSLQALENYEEGELIGQGSFGIIHKVKRKADGMVSSVSSFVASFPLLSPVRSILVLEFKKGESEVYAS